jgi:hypothetical protein
MRTLSAESIPITPLKDGRVQDEIPLKNRIRHLVFGIDQSVRIEDLLVLTALEHCLASGVAALSTTM